jgi:hypothetical protein
MTISYLERENVLKNEDIIKVNNKNFFKFALSEYKEKGRGCLVITDLSEQAINSNAHYCTLNFMKETIGEDNIITLIEEYDPYKEYVINIMEPDWNHSCSYKVRYDLVL